MIDESIYRAIENPQELACFHCKLNVPEEETPLAGTQLSGTAKLQSVLLNFARNVGSSARVFLTLAVWFYWLLKTVDGASTRAM
jgi:hypothetical protein